MQAARGARFLIRGKSLALFVGVGEFMVAIGKFHAAMVELEAQRHARIGWSSSLASAACEAG